jgi:hypothetical protein
MDRPIILSSTHNYYIFLFYVATRSCDWDKWLSDPETTLDALNQFMFSNGNLTNASNREDASKAARELIKERGCDNVWLDTWMSFNDYDNPSCYRPYLPTKSGYMFVYQRVSTLEGMEYITPAHTIDELSQLIGILSVLPRKDRGRLNQP